MKSFLTFAIGIAASCLLISASVIHNEPGVKVPCACDDEGRYDAREATGGGEPIVPTTACSMIVGYEKKVGSNRGGFISKKVLDNIFCNKSFNGINFYYALDESKETTTVRLVIEGAHLNNTLPGSLGSSADKYISEIICPPSCGSFSLEKCK